MAYAETTKVPVSRTQDQIKKMLRDIGADRIMILESSDEYTIYFEVPRDDGSAVAYKLSSPPLIESRYSPEQAERAAWRALGLLVKAKQVAVKQGISTVEREFMADTVMPDGTTLIEHHEEIIGYNYGQGGVPRLGFVANTGEG